MGPFIFILAVIVVVTLLAIGVQKNKKKLAEEHKQHELPNPIAQVPTLEQPGTGDDVAVEWPTAQPVEAPQEKKVVRKPRKPKADK